MSRQATEIRAAWREIVPNFDNALALAEARDHLIDLSAEAFARVPWREALQERMNEFPEFFDSYDYSWCAERECFDFPVEAAYQVRAIDAAIGFWLAQVHDKPASPALGNIVARTTYLAKFGHASPHVKTNRGIDFLISPLGWVEFIHRLFAAFAGAWYKGAGVGSPWATMCHDDWCGIIVNMIASSVDEVEIDYVLPAVIDRIVAEVPYFARAHAQFTSVVETTVSRDLARAAHDFALCHELAHIAARDEESPDESRADRWGLAAYLHSWPLQPALHLEIARSDMLRVSLGPIAFTVALRCLLAARVLVSARAGASASTVARQAAVFHAASGRSKALLGHVEAGISAPRTLPAGTVGERVKWNALVLALADYERAFGQSLQSLPVDVCGAACAAARRAGRV